MTQWTETARRTLDDYCNRSKAALAGTGADTNEVIEDLRRHVDEEIRAAGLTVVTEDDIRRILGRVGEPKPEKERQAMTPPTSPPVSPAPKTEKKRPGYILLVLGVVLPLITLVFEWTTGISAGVLFDPIPTWYHLLAIALVPVANLWIWLAGRAQDSRRAQLLGWLNGLALGISLFYSVLYLPLAPFACMAVIWFGTGLIPLAPYLAAVATLFLRGAYKKRIRQPVLPRAWKGALAAFGILVLLQFPTALTYYGLARASSNDAETRLQGLRLLRQFGDRELILRVCYGQLERKLNLDLVRIIVSDNQKVTTARAREIYYQVTGKPFNSVPPPSLYTRMGRWSALDDEFTWDNARGGEAVAGRVKGLTLAGSRMDAVAEPDAALVYCEWTMEFKNVSGRQREARAEIALPPGAVV